MKNIGIIGSSGMVGGDLTNLLKKNYKVTGISRSNYGAFFGKKFDVLINANGNSRRFWANNNSKEDFEASTLSVYKSIFDFKFDKYIYISSSDVYDNHTKAIYAKETTKINPLKLCHYGFHKYLSEQIVQKHCVDYVILRSCLMLGTSLKKGPIYDILNSLPLFISLNSKLQMITTFELSNIIHFIIKNNVKNQIINVGGKGTVNFNQLALFFANKVTVQKKAETQLYEMDVSKLNKSFPLKKSTKYLKRFLLEYIGNK